MILPLRRTIGIFLIAQLAVVAVPRAANAKDTLSAAIDRAAKSAAEQARPNSQASGNEKRHTMGVVLVGAGAGLILLSFLTGGADCPIGQFGPVCESTVNKGFMFAGLGAVGVGGFFMLTSGNPQIHSPRGIGIKKSVSW